MKTLPSAVTFADGDDVEARGDGCDEYCPVLKFMCRLEK